MRPPVPSSPAKPADAAHRWLKGAGRTVLCLTTAVALAAQGQPPAHPAAMPMLLPDDPSDNAYQASPDLAPELRRVAVLPPAWEGSASDLAAGGEALAPVLLSELSKLRKFEVVTVSPPDLRGLTGRLSWTGEEILPADFLNSLQRVYGCDAVLFFQMTRFQAYAPLAVGWRMKLVDVRTRQILWAVDEDYDAKQPGVLGQAHLFHALGQWVFRDSASDWQVENSPRQYGQYARAKSRSSLPNRKDMIKVSRPITDEPSKRSSDQKTSSVKKIYGN